MEILNLSRGDGKTYSCIEESLKTNRHILVATEHNKRAVENHSARNSLEKKYQRKLPEVYTVARLVNQRGISATELHLLIVDDLDWVLESFLSVCGANAGFATLTADK